MLIEIPNRLLRPFRACLLMVVVIPARWAGLSNFAPSALAGAQALKGRNSTVRRNTPGKLVQRAGKMRREMGKTGKTAQPSTQALKGRNKKAR
jgi:hypothetical protein